MRCKKILLINHNVKEITDLQNSLKEINCIHSLHVAKNGKDALDMLMGNYAQTSKVQPDLIFLNKVLPDMTGMEFLGIMRRYYSLKNIKVYLTVSEAPDFSKEVLEKFRVAGVIETPVDFKKNSAPVILNLKTELASEKQSAFFTLPIMLDWKENFSGNIINLFKAKTVAASQVFGVKVAAGIVSAAMVTGATVYTGNSSVTSRNERKVLGSITEKNTPTVFSNVTLVASEIQPECDVEADIPKVKKTIKKPVKIEPVIENSIASSDVFVTDWTPSIRVERDTTITR